MSLLHGPDKTACASKYEEARIHIPFELQVPGSRHDPAVAKNVVLHGMHLLVSSRTP